MLKSCIDFVAGDAPSDIIVWMKLRYSTALVGMIFHFFF